MKKTIIALLMAILLLCSVGCSKTKTTVGKPLSLEGLPCTTDSSIVDYMYYDHLAELQGIYDPEQTIVFRGIKEGLTTPVYVTANDGNFSHCETDLKVLGVFYGNIQANDIITVKEDIKVMEPETFPILECLDGVKPIAENEEYIFILAKNGQRNQKGGDQYGSYSIHYSHHKLSDYKGFKEKVQSGNATPTERFTVEVIEYYYSLK